MSVGCRIRRDFPRPDRALVEAFRGLPVANLDDCMGRIAAVDAGLKTSTKRRCSAWPSPFAAPPEII